MASQAQGAGAESGVLTTTYDLFFAQARRVAMRPLRLGMACCAVDWVPALDPRHDGRVLQLADAGGDPQLRTAPARSDLLIVAGTVAEMFRHVKADEACQTGARPALRRRAEGGIHFAQDGATVAS